MEAHIQINGNLSLENYASNHLDDDYHEQVSDCESCISYDSNENERIQGLFGDDLIRLYKNDAIFDVIGHVFLSNLGGFGKKNNTIIEAIHKMNWSYSRTMLARFKCFNIFRAALLEDDNNNGYNGVTSCMKYGWYCDDKDGIQRIVSLGFGHLQLGNRDGVRLSSVNSLAQSVQNCGIDENGLKHVILCRVLVEKGESSKELNSEVDEVISPSEYVVWSSKMNTHILPEYVVSFRTFPCLDGGHLGKKPAASPWLPFSTLISTISKFLPPPTINLINEHYKDFKKGKISRRNLIERLTRYVGKELIIKIIKRRGAKATKNSPDLSPERAIKASV